MFFCLRSLPQASWFIHPHRENVIRVGDIMQEIIIEAQEDGVQLIDHNASLLCVIAIDVRSICLSKVNEIMHFDMAFHCVNDELNI